MSSHERVASDAQESAASPRIADGMTPGGAAIPYVDLVALVGETNRCPGGKRSVARLAGRLRIGPWSRVLEVGANTGFTSFELAAITGCRVSGIEVNAAAVAEAQRRRTRLPPAIASRVNFHVGDACALPFDTGSFDVVVCGGANGFIRDRAAAFAEYRRVLRPFGLASITHLYYEREPSANVLVEVRAVLGFDIPVYGWRQWLDELAPPEWEVYDVARRRLAPRPAPVVEEFVKALTGGERLAHLDPATRQRVSAQWRRACHAFNANHRYLGFLELALRRPPDGWIEQPELFIEPDAYDPHFTHDFVAALDPQTNSTVSTAVAP